MRKHYISIKCFLSDLSVHPGSIDHQLLKRQKSIVCASADSHHHAYFKTELINRHINWREQEKRQRKLIQAIVFINSACVPCTIGSSRLVKQLRC